MKFHKIGTRTLREDQEGNTFFFINSMKIHISDFIRCHNNPWVDDVYPEYIHAISTDFQLPYAISLDTWGETVKVYEILEDDEYAS